jgi:pimeloyl-ACP methyl ester carboxylesterase
MIMSLKPPASLLLVHGAGSGQWVYKDWTDTFSHTMITAIDLQEHVNVAGASMTHYADRVVAAAVGMEQPVAIVGWSMGGLVVMLAVQRLQPHSVILLETSASLEIQGSNLDVELVEGVFDPEAVYGSFPVGMQARPTRRSLVPSVNEAFLFLPCLVPRWSFMERNSGGREARPLRIITTPTRLSSKVADIGIWSSIRECDQE